MLEKVGIYCRLSDEDRFKKNKSDDSESIANQKSMLLKYALSKNWEVVNVYSDDDWSGADSNRPQFKKLIEDCEKGLIDIVLCKTQSRFSRDMEMIEKYIHNKFVEWGVRFVSIVDNADTEIRGNKKSRQINGLVNEWYLEDLSENVRSSLQNKRDDGEFLGSFAPYGYMKDPENKNKLIVDPVASEIVKKIFEMYKKGYGYNKIAQYLFDNHVLTPYGYKKNNGSKYVCGTATEATISNWCPDTISQILHNEVYIGNLVQGKKTYVSYKNHKTILKPKEQWTRVEATHEPIIDIETWNSVQRKFNDRVKPSRVTGEICMFTRKVYCKECGLIFGKQVYKVKGGKADYLKCKGVRLPAIRCHNIHSIRLDSFEELILKEINKQIDKYYNIDELERIATLKKKSLNKELFNKKENLTKEKKDLEGKISIKNEHYKSLYEDKLDGLISQTDFITFKEKFKQEIHEYEERIKCIDNELKNFKTSEETVISTKKILQKYHHIEKLNREIIEEFIDKIYIGTYNPETHERDIDIRMNIINLD